MKIDLDDVETLLDQVPSSPRAPRKIRHWRIAAITAVASVPLSTLSIIFLSELWANAFISLSVSMCLISIGPLFHFWVAVPLKRDESAMNKISRADVLWGGLSRVRKDIPEEKRAEIDVRIRELRDAYRKKAQEHA